MTICTMPYHSCIERETAGLNPAELCCRECELFEKCKINSNPCRKANCELEGLPIPEELKEIIEKGKMAIQEANAARDNIFKYLSVNYGEIPKYKDKTLIEVDYTGNLIFCEQKLQRLLFSLNETKESNEIIQLSDKTGFGIPECQKAMDFCKEHPDCLPIAYLKAKVFGPPTPNLTWEQRVKYFSESERKK